MPRVCGVAEAEIWRPECPTNLATLQPSLTRRRMIGALVVVVVRGVVQNDDHPIIALKNCRVSDFGGRSLSTSRSSLVRSPTPLSQPPPP